MEDTEFTEYEDEVDEEYAVIDKVPKLQIFLKILGILILIVGLVILIYFQWEDLKISRSIVPNETYIYNGSCEEGICTYLVQDSLLDSLKCSYNNNETDCSKILIKGEIKGNKTCENGICILETVETIDECFVGGWSIDCDKIEVENK